VGFNHRSVIIYAACESVKAPSLVITANMLVGSCNHPSSLRHNSENGIPKLGLRVDLDILYRSGSQIPE
jgi:hypothetical protein